MNLNLYYKSVDLYDTHIFSIKSYQLSITVFWDIIENSMVAKDLIVLLGTFDFDVIL